MEPQYLPKTNELLHVTRQLRAFMAENLSSQLVGVDIESQTSPYRQNEDSLKSALDRISNSLDIIETRIDFIDTLPFNFKNNVHSYINQILAWMQPNTTLQNFSNIISYSESIYTQLYQYGLASTTINADDVNKIFNSINASRRDLGDISELRSLKRDLAEIKQADISIPTAKSLINVINNNKSILEAKRVADEILDLKDEFTNDLEQIRLLKESKTLEKLESKFKDQSNDYRKLANKWLIALCFSLTLFAFSALYVVCLSVGVNHMEIYVPGLFEVNHLFSSSLTLLFLVIIIVMFKNNHLLTFLIKLFSILLILSFIKDGFVIIIPQIEALAPATTTFGIISGLLIRSIILSPAILLIVYTSRGYVRNIKLAEDYEYKFISSATFDTLINKSSALSGDFKPQNLIEKIITNIYGHPHSDVTSVPLNTEMSNVSVGNFLNSPVVTKIIDLTSKLRS